MRDALDVAAGGAYDYGEGLLLNYEDKLSHEYVTSEWWFKKRSLNKNDFYKYMQSCYDKNYLNLDKHYQYFFDLCESSFGAGCELVSLP